MSESDAIYGLLKRLLRERREEILRRWGAEVLAAFRRRGRGYDSSGEALQESMGHFLAFLLEHVEKGAEYAGEGEDAAESKEGGFAFQFGEVVEMQSHLKGVLLEMLRKSMGEDSERWADLEDAVDRLVNETSLETASLYYRMSEHELEASRRETQQVASICRMTTAIISSLDLGELCRTLGAELPSLAPFRQARISVLSEGGDSLRQVWVAPGEARPAQQRHIELDEKSSYYWVITRREPHVVSDLETTRGFFDDEEERAQGMRSRIVLPIVTRDEVIGALDLVHDQPGRYAERHVPILSQIASQLGVAVECMRLLTRERKRAEQLRIVGEMVRQVGSLGARELLARTAEAIQESFDFYHVSILLVDRAANEVELVACAGASDEQTTAGYRQPLGEGMVGWVAQHGEKLVANNVAKEPRRIIAFDWELAAGSEMCLPIQLDGEVVGVLNVESSQVDAFDADDVRAMETISDEIAAAMQWARLRAEREQAERAAAEAREQLDYIGRSLSLGIAATDLDGVYVHWGPGSARLTGFEPAEVIGQRSPADFARSDYDLKALIDTCRSEGHAEVEVLMQTKSDAPVWVRQVWTNLLDAGGEHVGYVCYMEDVTQRREAEEALRQERDKLNRIIDLMGAGLCIIDSDGRITYANQTLLDWLAVDEQTARELRCCELFKRSAERCAPCGFEIVVRTGKPHRTEQWIMSPDGQTRYLQHVYAPLRDDSGAITSVIKLTQDVTQNIRRVQQVSLLHQLGQEMQGTLDLDRLLYLVLTCITAGQQGLGFNRAMLFLINEKERQLEGRMAVGAIEQEEAIRAWREIEDQHMTLREMIERYDPEALAASPLQQLVSSARFSLDDHNFLIDCIRERRAKVVDSLEEAGESARAFLEKIGGGQFVCAPLVAKDKAIGVVLADNRFNARSISPEDVRLLSMFATQAGLAIDTADAYRRLEQQMLDLDKAHERLMRAERLAVVGELAAHIAHEIRNPLVTIGGFARNILRQKGLDEKVRRNAHIIVQEVERLERILKSVMDFTKPSQPIIQQQDLNELVKDVVEELRPTAQEEGVDIETDLSDEVGEIPIDPDQIKQVLINIIKNGVEAVAAARDQAEDGEPPPARPILVRTEAGEGFAEVSVQDWGVGMPQEILENIFDPFYTVKVDGTGLGLAVTQKIVADHGGEILVESEEGVGATFRIRLPLERGPEEPLDPRDVLESVRPINL